MPLPELTPGLIVNYEYLWHRRSEADTADKDHPACVVATFRQTGKEQEGVIYLPISHSPPGEDEVGLEIPPDVKRRIGLDSARQWILISECNLDIWPFDLRHLPRRPGHFHYGILPPAAFNFIRDQFVERYRNKKRAHRQSKRPATVG